MAGRKWSKEEVKILRKYYPINPKKVFKLLDRTMQAIYGKAKNLGIKSKAGPGPKTGDMNMKPLTKEKIIELYWKKELSGLKIAKRLRMSTSKVYKFMRRNNIPRRSISKAHKINSKHFNLSDKVKNYLDGLILGDAYIGLVGEYSARLVQLFSVKFEEWAKKIKKISRSLGYRLIFIPRNTLMKGLVKIIKKL